MWLPINDHKILVICDQSPNQINYSIGETYLPQNLYQKKSRYSIIGFGIYILMTTFEGFPLLLMSELKFPSE